MASRMDNKRKQKEIEEEIVGSHLASIIRTPGVVNKVTVVYTVGKGRILPRVFINLTFCVVLLDTAVFRVVITNFATNSARVSPKS